MSYKSNQPSILLITNSSIVQEVTTVRTTATSIKVTTIITAAWNKHKKTAYLL